MHFALTVCTGAVPTNTGLLPALHRAPGNGVQLGQTPTTLGSPFLSSLPRSQEYPQILGTNLLGEALVWGVVTAPHMVLTPLWHCLPPTHIHTGPRESAGTEPTQPALREDLKRLSITHNEVFLVMLGFSHPSQQRETPLTAWLSVRLFGHHFGQSPGTACSS